MAYPGQAVENSPQDQRRFQLGRDKDGYGGHARLGTQEHGAIHPRSYAAMGRLYALETP